MVFLRTSAGALAVALGAILFYVLLAARVSYDLLAVVCISSVVLISMRDKRYLFVGWFLFSPYFYPLGTKGQLNLASNISHNLFVPLVAIVTIGSILVQRRRLAFGTEDLFFLAFVLYALFSSFFTSGGRYEDLKAIYVIYVIPYLLFTVAKNVTIDPHFLKVIAYSSLFHLTVLSVMGYFEYISGQSLYTEVLLFKEIGLWRIAGPFASPIILGLCVSFLSLSGFLALRLQLISRLTFWAIMLFSAILYVLTFTRSVWLGVVASTLYLIFRVPGKPGARVVRLLVFAGLIALLGGYLLSFPDIANRFYESRNADFRIVMAYASIQMIANSPILGSGFGTFDSAILNYIPNMLGVRIVKDTSHVTLLTVLAELGMAGLLLLVLFVLRALSKRGLRLRGMPTETQLIVIINIAFIVAFAVNAFLIDMRFFSLAYCWLFISLGMVQNVYRNGYLSN
jgi:hypothetical protein